MRDGIGDDIESSTHTDGIALKKSALIKMEAQIEFVKAETNDLFDELFQLDAVNQEIRSGNLIFNKHRTEIIYNCILSLKNELIKIEKIRSEILYLSQKQILRRTNKSEKLQAIIDKIRRTYASLKEARKALATAQETSFRTISITELSPKTESTRRVKELQKASREHQRLQTQTYGTVHAPSEEAGINSHHYGASYSKTKGFVASFKTKINTAKERLFSTTNSAITEKGITSALGEVDEKKSLLSPQSYDATEGMHDGTGESKVFSQKKGSAFSYVINKQKMRSHNPLTEPLLQAPPPNLRAVDLKNIDLTIGDQRSAAGAGIGRETY